MKFLNNKNESIMNTPKYNITIKEYGRSKPLHTAHIGREMTEQELIDFYGLAEPDVEWYKIEKES